MTPATSDDLHGTLQSIVTALRHAQASGRAWALCDALTCAGRAYRILDAPKPALAVFDLALRWSYACGSADLRVDVLCELCETHVQAVERLAAPAANEAEAAACRASAAQARELAYEAARLAPQVTDACWEVKVLLRLSDLLDRIGDHDEATALQGRAMMREAGAPAPLRPVAADACGTLH